MRTLAELLYDTDSRASQEEFYRRTKRIVFSALKSFPDKELIADSLSQAWLKILENKNLYAPSRGSFEAFMIMLTKNLIIDSMRKFGSCRVVRVDSFEEDERISDDEISNSCPLDIFCVGEMSWIIQEAIETLPEKYQIALYSKFFLGEKTPETAIRLDVSENAVGMYVSRGLAYLRRQLKNRL